MAESGNRQLTHFSFTHGLGGGIMKRIVVITVLVFCFTSTAQAGWLDKVKESVPDAVKQGMQGQSKETTPETAKQGTVSLPVKQENPGQSEETTKPAAPLVRPPASGLSPDQQDANACTAYVHEDWKKSKQALKESNLTRGSSSYLPKKEWIDYLKSRYPNLKKKDFYFHFGKWFGKSCAYVDLTCRSNEPGCDIQMKCLDFYTRKGGQTCPSNLCSYNDTKCIEPYKSPEK
jgi:hypothetical protein